MVTGECVLKSLTFSGIVGSHLKLNGYLRIELNEYLCIELNEYLRIKLNGYLRIELNEYLCIELNEYLRIKLNKKTILNIATNGQAYFAPVKNRPAIVDFAGPSK